MGAFFTNYQVRADSINPVRDAVGELAKSRAYVSSPKNGWVTIYDETSEDQDDSLLRKMAAGLSVKLKTSVLALLVHDSDIAAYWLFQNGKQLDEFNSDPDYFQESDDDTRTRVRGNAMVLLPLCVAGTTRAQLESVLHDPEGPPPKAENIFHDLAPLLGIDPNRIALGFQYFEDEGPEILPDIGEFQPIGRNAERKAATPRAASASVATPPDLYPVAVGMLVQTWNAEKILGPQMAKKNFVRDSIVKPKTF